MKKLITSTIIILPLIILAILLVSGAIMSLTTHIYVEALDLAKEDVIWLRMEDENNPPTYNLDKDITILPLKATNRVVLYRSEDEEIVSVSENGLITAKFYGETYVTVTSKENKAATKRRKVVVTDDKVHALRMNDGYKTDLYENEAQQMAVTVYPKEALNKGIKWSSSAPSILDVSANGIATSIGAGKAKVIATSVENETIVAEVEITCHKKLTGLNFVRTMVETASEELNFPQITPSPADITPEDVSYTYTSSDDQIATVTNSGAIKFLKPGKVTITVTATDFKGTQVSGEKVYISTCGYFKNPIFVKDEFDWDDYTANEGQLLPEGDDGWFNKQLEGTYKGIGKIECKVDGELAEQFNNMLTFTADHKFKFGSGLDCTEYVEFIIHLTSFDDVSNSLVVDGENGMENVETIKFSKNPSQSGAGAVVKFNGEQIKKSQEGINNITITDLGEKGKIELTVSDTEVVPKVFGTAFVKADPAPDVNKITLVGVAPTEENQTVTISIGVSVFKLSVKVEAKADKFTVKLNGTELTSNSSHKTLLDQLTFTVEPIREDGQEVTNKAVEYSNNSGSPSYADGGEITIDIGNNNSIDFKCDYAEFHLDIQKIKLEDFGVEFSASISNVIKLEEISSVVAQTDEYLVRLPSNIQDSVTLEILPKMQLLGGFGSNATFETMFSVDLTQAEGWEKHYSALNNQITLNFKNGERELNKTVTLTYGEVALTIRFIRINLTSITFTGYDIDAPTNKYLGYQQVRVFAKHSFYGIGNAGKKVDYFKIPLEAKADGDNAASMDALTWSLSRYVGNGLDSVLTRQIGKNIEFNGKKYTLEQASGSSEYILKDAEGNIVVNTDGVNAQGIIFVDAFSEPGFARIYFGNFVGLRETDVQNDYFGNFGEQENWHEPATTVDDGSGRATDKSETNSFSFLRIMAGDGTDAGINCHFNFNVLNDLGADDTANLQEVNQLVNVFNATGYYKYANVVLHSNLYGPGELSGDGSKEQQASDNDLILNQTTSGNSNDANVLGKTRIFGNGYNVNFEAKNAELKKDSNKNNSWGVNIGRAYNTKIKCANPENTINYLRQKIVFNANYLYYCDVEYYEKMRPLSGGGTTFIKNCSLRNISEGAYMLYYDKEKAYLENVVIVNSLSGFEFGNGKFSAGQMDLYLKGNFDVLNYVNKEAILKLAGNYANTFAPFFNEIMLELDSYLEWFGNSADSVSMDTQRFVNLIMYIDNTGFGDIKSKVINYWTDEGYKSTTSYGDQKNVTSGDVVINRVLNFLGMLAGWTYDVNNGIDGGIMQSGMYKSRDMNELFTDERYIRLLCQYKYQKGDGTLVENTEHIQWHINQVHRDLSLIDGLDDHITDLVHSLEDKDGQHIDWYGNSTAQDAIDLWKQAQSTNKALTTFVLPSKKEY